MSGFNNTSQVLCKTIDARNGSLQVVTDQRQLDAFARLRVSNPFTISPERDVEWLQSVMIPHLSEVANSDYEG